MNLYELEANFLEMVNRAESADGSDQQAINDTIESLQSGIVDKAIDYGHVIQQLEADRDQLKAKIKHDQDRLRVVRNNAKRMREALKQGMDIAGITHVKDADTSISLQKGQPNLVVSDEKAIPEDYYSEQKPTLQKKALIADLKAGVKVPGVELQPTKTIRIN